MKGMMELAENEVKLAIRNMFHMFRNIKENMIIKVMKEMENK